MRTRLFKCLQSCYESCDHSNNYNVKALFQFKGNKELCTHIKNLQEKNIFLVFLLKNSLQNLYQTSIKWTDDVLN